MSELGKIVDKAQEVFYWPTVIFTPNDSQRVSDYFGHILTQTKLFSSDAWTVITSYILTQTYIKSRCQYLHTPIQWDEQRQKQTAFQCELSLQSEYKL